MSAKYIIPLNLGFDMFTNLRENISGGQIAKLGFSDFAGIYQKFMFPHSNVLLNENNL